MNQLSTATKLEKSILLDRMKAEIEKIPNFLTKKYLPFQQMVIQQIQSKITTMINIEALRQIAILIYKIMIIQT
jgi:hypothetical protein